MRGTQSGRWPRGHFRRESKIGDKGLKSSEIGSRAVLSAPLPPSGDLEEGRSGLDESSVSLADGARQAARRARPDGFNVWGRYSQICRGGPANGTPQLGWQALGRGWPAGPQALGAAADPPGLSTDTFVPRQQPFGVWSSSHIDLPSGAGFLPPAAFQRGHLLPRRKRGCSSTGGPLGEPSQFTLSLFSSLHPTSIFPSDPPAHISPTNHW